MLFRLNCWERIYSRISPRIHLLHWSVHLGSVWADRCSNILGQIIYLPDLLAALPLGWLDHTWMELQKRVSVFFESESAVGWGHVSFMCQLRRFGESQNDPGTLHRLQRIVGPSDISQKDSRSNPVLTKIQVHAWPIVTWPNQYLVPGYFIFMSLNMVRS